MPRPDQRGSAGATPAPPALAEYSHVHDTLAWSSEFSRRTEAQATLYCGSLLSTADTAIEPCYRGSLLCLLS